MAEPVPQWVCPRCHTPRTGRFCDQDGHDSQLPAQSWTLVVIADRKYYEFVQRTGNAMVTKITFPDYCPQRQFRLRDGQMLIGRSDTSRGIEPQIDLIGPPTDPAVSRSHAMLVAAPDGSWTLVDLGSTNGTFLNYATDPIEPNIAVRIGSEDRFHVGGWTTLTLRTND
jgi:hypothetical protein